MKDATIRLATPSDVDGIVAVIDGVLNEYGDRICTTPGGSEADVLDIESGYRSKGGEFWVLETFDVEVSRIVGTHATRPDPLQPTEVCTFKRLYLHRDLRGSNCGRDLMQTTIDWARDKNFKRVEFWSDTRFARAHRFFQKFGFQTSGEVRQMTDSMIPYAEYFFFLDL